MALRSAALLRYAIGKQVTNSRILYFNWHHVISRNTNDLMLGKDLDRSKLDDPYGALPIRPHSINRQMPLDIEPEEEIMDQFRPRCVMKASFSEAYKQQQEQIREEWDSDEPLPLYDEIEWTGYDPRDTFIGLLYSPRRRISVELLEKMWTKWDFSVRGFATWLNKKIELKETRLQTYSATRHGVLGPDLATAHFITFRGGKAKFKHKDEWYTIDTDLPWKHHPHFKLIGLDASGCNLRYQALDNLTYLEHLEELDLGENPYIDDWFVSRLARNFRFSKNLGELNLGFCPQITQLGVEALIKIPSLQRVVLTGTKAADYQFLDLLRVLFQDVKPTCELID